MQLHRRYRFAMRHLDLQNREDHQFFELFLNFRPLNSFFRQSPDFEL